ncbi:cell division protein ZapD [Usitatibacter palustris]|uniref:cell division protein ZapD n=1 Tax=Usitatibacter palustris TaxID=2732487 RepID=UPI001488947E|nr:cell division protein ZapD [Usitatibacter palustris]
MITYEYPLNERVRTLLRLEDLYDRVNHFYSLEHAHDHHACLTGMFEIIEVASRADLKSDLLQELDRQRTFLDALRDNPAISRDKLDQVLTDLDSAFSNLHATSGKTGQNLRENEWLMAIKQRAGIPGGTSEFDLPSYHYWLQHPADDRRNDLAVWMKPLQPVHSALSLVLRVLRESGRTVSLVATQGMFQQTPAEKPAQMLRLTIASDLACIPEISANKYALNIRFLVPEGVQKSRVYDRDVAFELAFCNL